MLFEFPWLFVTQMWNGRESTAKDFGSFGKVGAEIRAYGKGFDC